MSAVPAALFLTDFGADGDIAPLQPGGPVHDEGAKAAAKLEESYARGMLNGRAAAQTQFNTKLEEQRKAFAVELAAERKKWATATGKELAKRLNGTLEELERRVGDATGRILKPFVEEEVRRQAIAELQASLKALVSTDPGVSVHISGPADVLDALREQLAAKTLAVTYTPSDDCDVKIVAGQATLETRLKTWMEKLQEAVP